MGVFVVPTLCKWILKTINGCNCNNKKYVKWFEGMVIQCTLKFIQHELGKSKCEFG
jgi:hypothetical protein